MQKIKLAVLQSWTNKALTSSEINFLIYISRYQNESGQAIGIYYKDVCEALGISVQTFYNIKKSLVNKQVISIQRFSDIDYDIRITGNDFSDRNFQDGYINTNRLLFYSKSFFDLKAAEKLICLELMKNTYCNHGKFIISKSNFYSKYMEVYHVTKRVIRGYLGRLRKYFHVILEKGKYIFVPKKAEFEKTNRSEGEVYAEKIISTGCRRQKIKEVPSKAMKDTCVLISQYREYTKDIAESMLCAIKESINVINMYNSPKVTAVRELRPKLIHRILRNMILKK